MAEGIFRRLRCAWHLLLTFLIALCSAESLAKPGRFRAGRLIVLPKAGMEEQVEGFRKGKRHKLRKQFAWLGGMRVVETGAGEEVESAVRAYRESGWVEFAEPDYILRASVIPNDPGFSRLWSFQHATDADIDATQAWDARSSAEEVVVAVIDSGVRYTHEDLAANMWVNSRETANGIDDDRNGYIDDLHGINAINRSGSPADDNGHGTHVAGTIGAAGNNGKGVAGVCWKVKIMALKFMDSTAEGDTSDAIACINYARANGAKIINASWGGAGSSYALRSAISAARNAGIIFVAAAGNESLDNDLYPSYPANYSLDNIVSVAASDRTGALDPYYSNYGLLTVDIAAPGTGIYSTWHASDTAYLTISGTSMAAPHVSGALALLRATYPNESYRAIIARLYAGAERMDALTGWISTGARLHLGNLFPRLDPPKFTSVTLGAHGTVRFAVPDRLEGYQLQSSTNLTDWQSVDGLSISGLQQFSAADRQCFYRLIKPLAAENGL